MAILGRRCGQDSIPIIKYRLMCILRVPRVPKVSIIFNIVNAGYEHLSHVDTLWSIILLGEKQFPFD